MPELPEVETIRKTLWPAVTGRTILQAEASANEVMSVEDCEQLIGKTVTDIRRRGKYLLFLLQEGNRPSLWLLVHLRMTGRLLIHRFEDPLPKHTHVRLVLQSVDLQRTLLIFQDTRRFGRMWLRRVSDSSQLPTDMDKLGPEPVDPPLAKETLKKQLKKHPALTLKAALLNQSVIAGIGNIYADEILYAAGLPPQQRAGTLGDNQISQLATAIPQVLQQAIAKCGTTLRDYVDGWSREGRFQNCLNVYGRAGLPCRHCGQTLLKTRLAGRTTTWCPSCQPRHSEARQTDS